MKSFKYILRSLINNAVIIEGRKRKWLESFVVFIIAMIIALIPSTVTSATVTGSAIIDTKKTNSYGVEDGLKYFSETMKEKGISFKIVQENKSKIITIIESEEKWGDNTNGEYYRNFVDDYFYYKRTDRVYQKDENDETVGYEEKLVERLRVYQYVDLDNAALNKKLSEIQSQKIEDEPVSSFLAIGKTTCFFFIYSKTAKNWSNPVATRQLTYDRFKDGQEVISNYTGNKSIEIWAEFLDTGYETTKITTVFSQMGIFAAINVLVSLFMSIMIFVVTRGKRNPYRDYKFTEAMKIVGIASLAPSIISAIVGFILPAYSSMIFMLLIGVRIMWLTSKNLNPAIEKK